jgi:2-keto-4-pentenoate hydratase/2-oxohepta-3-ene-1,7-dioic acid hydratase in catechol pathway
VRICRVSVDDDLFFGALEGLTASGEVTDATMVALFHGHPFGELQASGRVLPLRDLRLVAPMLPSKIIAVGKNYADHAKEMGGQPPVTPMIFLKPSTSIIGPDEPIVLPWQSEQVEHEAELAVVIGRMCKDVPIERVPEVVFGYTCANDVTARDLQQIDGQWSRAKGFDSFCPIGPWIETDLDIDEAEITCTVNDEVRQRGSAVDMVHGIPELISMISGVMTLLPGDIILTGTPAGVSPVRAGDVVEVTVSGIGTLRNPVIDCE